MVKYNVSQINPYWYFCGTAISSTETTKATPYNKRKQKIFDGDRDLREQFSFLPLLRPLFIGVVKPGW